VGCSLLPYAHACATRCRNVQDASRGPSISQPMCDAVIMSDRLKNLLACDVGLILTLATLILVTAWDFQRSILPCCSSSWSASASDSGLRACCMRETPTVKRQLRCSAAGHDWERTALGDDRQSW
jgi:hypothetical protein